jgi:Fe-S-cluster containining protein
MVERKPSAVAGILDKKGGLRVVVTQRWRMRHHVGRDERLFVVPDYEVQEPVSVADAPALIERVQTYVAKELAPTNHCGECRACCFFPKLNTEITGDKPAGQWCTHCSGTGCKIYWNRPKVCREYVCVWLASQKRNDRMKPELRPDKCGVIFLDDSTTNDPLVFEVHGGEPNADAWEYIKEMQRLGYKARKITSYIA